MDLRLVVIGATENRVERMEREGDLGCGMVYRKLRSVVPKQWKLEMLEDSRKHHYYHLYSELW